MMEKAKVWNSQRQVKSKVYVYHYKRIKKTILSHITALLVWQGKENLLCPLLSNLPIDF